MWEQLLVDLTEPRKIGNQCLHPKWPTLLQLFASISKDPLEALEKMDQVFVAVNFLDSVVRLPEDIYRGI